jgi:hypothetical protein
MLTVAMDPAKIAPYQASADSAGAAAVTTTVVAATATQMEMICDQALFTVPSCPNGAKTSGKLH